MIRKNIKSVFCILFALILVLVSSGCSKSKTETSTASPSSAPSAAEAQKPQGPEPITLPIVKEPITLSYFISMNTKVSATLKNYGEIRCYQELEKRTGIHINFMHPPAGQDTEQFNLILASGDLPDMIYWTWTSVPGGPGKLLQDGAIIKVNDLIDKYAPNLKKMLSDNPNMSKQSMLDDGTYYMFPFIRIGKVGEVDNRVNNGFQVRKDWLDKLGLQVPKTLDDWYNVLTQIKTKDPNGNGKQDELPFVALKSTGLKNFELPFGMVHGFYNDNGKVKFSPIEPAYKNYLTLMAKWYKEGLIDPDYMTTDDKMFESKVTTNLAGSYYGLISGNLGRFMQLVTPKDPKFELNGTPYPIGPAGKKFATRDLDIPGGGLVITNKDKYPKETAKWIDYAYSKEGNMLMNYGPDGEAYEIVNGVPKWKDIVMKNPNGIPFDQASSRYGIAGVNGAFVQDINHYAISMNDVPQKLATNKTWSDSDFSLMMPPVTPKSDETQKLAKIVNEANTYVDEFSNKVIIGKESIDNFDKFVQTIKGMGIDDAVKIQQSALDRYNGRK